MRGRYLLPVLPVLLGDAPPPPPCPQAVLLPLSPLETVARPAPRTDLLALTFPIPGKVGGGVVCSRPAAPPRAEAQEARGDVLHSLPAPDLTSVIPAPLGH